ncbi:Flp family type IVb pilin [Pseudomonas sp.]|uniref:Flp family type IVb pilin n=1 Tax=Pseudomonas sp. TaxID=306 RepID=UPI00258EDB7C|nr:Flp family type IVb pilin [Pseudomonas sp.]
MSLVKMKHKVVKFLRDKDGASGIEYAIIAAMIAVFIFSFSTTIQAGLTNVFNNIRSALP